MDQREELLNRAKDRLKNLKKVELKSEKAFKEPTVASRYPRKSMAASANIQTPQIREMDSPSAAVENNSSVLNTAAASSPRKRGTRFLSMKEMNNTRQKLQKLNSISYMLERNVSLANPDPYDQLPVFISPAAEPENVRRRRGLLDRLSKPVDDKPLNEKDIKDIQEMNELYGTNSLQSLRKWECSWESQNQSYNYTFCFPVVGAPEPRVRWTETSPSDGFFVGERPVISNFNYQRLLQRLQMTDSNGNWFIGPRELEIAPDPLNYVHYRNTAALNYNSNYNTIHPETEGNDTTINIGKDQYREIQLVRKLPHFANQLEKPKLSSPYLLIVEISSIVFKAHPLLHLELDLCNKLTGYLESLNTRKQNALVWYLQEKIWATRVDIAERYAKLLELYAAQPDIASKNGAIDFVARRRLTLHKTNSLDHVQQLEFDLVQSLKELNQLRQLRDAEAQTDLMLEFNVVKTWESIKQLRQSQGYQSTGHKLTIRINAPSNPIDLKKELTDEIEELEMQLYIENQIEARQYLQVIDDYNLNDTISAMDTGSDQKQAKKSRPLEPDLLALDIEQVSAEIKKRHKKSFGSSKQQSISFKWENRVETVTPDLKCPDLELNRRNKVANAKHFLAIYLNNVQVTRTVVKQFRSQDFTITFNGTKDLAESSKIKNLRGSDTRLVFGIQISHFPESFVAKLYEQTLKNGDKLVAEIALPLPEAANVAGALNNEAAQVGFACISSENSIGVLEISSSWGTDKNGAPLAPTELKKSFYDEESFSMRNLGANPGLMNLKTMMEWISDPKIDPNDPRNVVITKMKNLLKELSSNDKDLKDQNVFRLGLPSWLHDMTLSVEPGVSANTLKRFEVLIKRSKGELKLSQPVPLNFTTHMAEITSSETNTIRDETEQNTVRKWSERNNITELKDSDESINMGFLKRIRDLQLIRKSALEIPQHVDQYVVEARLQPAVITDFDFFGIFRPSRPLNPQRLNRKMFLTTDADHCRLMIQILQGYNLPTRLNTSQSRIDDTTLRPFCEFTFQRRKFHTNTVMGNNPLFNETVAVPIIAKNGDFKADALMETDLATETLYINIYDEIIVDLIQDDKEREREIYYRRDKVWIGSLEIPFCSIWERSRVDGKFPIAVPISLLGYTSENPNQYPSIHIFLTLDPPLSQPRILDLKFKSNEPAELISKATSFQAAHNRIGTDSCMVLTHDLEGKITLVCRFIRPQNPPSGLDTIQLVTRFVAMIPHLPSRTVFKVKCHLWATSNQILSVGAADSIEHSILLCNYLLHLGYNAYVATGSSLIQGSFSFVLIPIENQFTNNYYSPRKTGFNINNFLGMQDANISPMYNCIDPVSGKIYNQMEVRAHGIEITACFNDKNHYYNMQPSKKFNDVNFKFVSPFWTSLFGNTPPILNSIQPSVLSYQKVDKNWVAELELAIERFVVEKFESWRKGISTRWNRLASKSLKQLLSNFEQQKVNGETVEHLFTEAVDVLNLKRIYSMTGLPINVCYSDVPACSDAVYHTDIHQNVSTGVEFAFAVHCVGYPNNFTSVWMFIASLCRR